jgi:uncharacterized protein YndB with AHSA1/START domain
MTEQLLPHALDRTVLIRARRDTVFRYFTDSRRWADWWGAGSRIDPEVGGSVLVRYPNGVEAGGEVLAIEPPVRIVFSYGYASGRPIPLGASRVTVELDEVADGTLLRLRHELADAGVRDQHVQGWRYQLSLFANAVADEAHADAAGRADAWFEAWSEPDATTREAAVAERVTPEIRFRDRFSAIEGIDELLPHLAAVHAFMPGLRIERDGPIHHCQGTALCAWTAKGTDGAERGRGTNVFTFDADGRIIDVVGLWVEGAVRG